jgi:hypothetical protein
MLDQQLLALEEEIIPIIIKDGDDDDTLESGMTESAVCVCGGVGGRGRERCARVEGFFFSCHQQVGKKCG